MNEIVLLNISGQDRPGITATLTGILARYDIPVLDIGQSVIHDALALGLLVELPQDTASCPMFKDLLFTAHENGLNIDQIRRLSGRISRQQSATDRPASVQMTLRGAVNDLSTAHAAFLQLGQAMDVDIAIQQVAILSGGFTYFAEHLQRRFGIDYVYANQLEFDNGRLTGKVRSRHAIPSPTSDSTAPSICSVCAIATSWTWNSRRCEGMPSLRFSA